jgi:hypothetical protein
MAPEAEGRPRVLGRKEDDALARAACLPRTGRRYALQMSGASESPKLDVKSFGAYRTPNVPTQAGCEGGGGGEVPRKEVNLKERDADQAVGLVRRRGRWRRDGRYRGSGGGEESSKSGGVP